MIIFEIGEEDFVNLVKTKQRIVYYFVGKYALHLYFYDGVVHKTVLDYEEDFKNAPRMAFEDFVQNILTTKFEGVQTVKLKNLI